MSALKNHRHEKFAQAIFRGMSQTQAAKEAGYNDGGAHVRGSELVRNRKIAGRIRELFDALKDDAIMGKRELGMKYTDMLRSTLGDFVTIDADGRTFIQVTPEQLAISGLKKAKFKEKIDEHGNTVFRIELTDLEVESVVTIGTALSKLMGYDADKKVDLGDESIDALKQIIELCSNRGFVLPKDDKPIRTRSAAKSPASAPEG